MLRACLPLPLVLLISLVGHPIPAFAAETDVDTLISAQGCRGCHAINGVGGLLGPALDGVGTRLTATEIRQKLTYPKSSSPESKMPDFRHLPDSELVLLTEFFSNLK